MLSRLSTSAVAIVAVVGTGMSVQAAPITPSDPFITVNFAAGVQTGSLNVALGDVGTVVAGVFYQYQTVTPSYIYEGNNPLNAKIAEVTLSATVHAPEVDLLAPGVFNADYRVIFGFSVRSLVGTTANVDITSPEISFAGIDGGVTAVSSSFTGTDSSANDTIGDGSIHVAGLLAGLNAWQASYNGGLDYATVLAGNSATGLPGITVGNAANPLLTPILGTVTSIRTKYSFSVSPEDAVSGTSVFGVIPTPGAGALLALGGTTVARRRRVR